MDAVSDLPPALRVAWELDAGAAAEPARSTRTHVSTRTRSIQLHSYPSAVHEHQGNLKPRSRFCYLLPGHRSQATRRPQHLSRSSSHNELGQLHRALDGGSAPWWKALQRCDSGAGRWCVGSEPRLPCCDARAGELWHQILNGYAVAVPISCYLAASVQKQHTSHACELVPVPLRACMGCAAAAVDAKVERAFAWARLAGCVRLGRSEGGTTVRAAHCSNSRASTHTAEQSPCNPHHCNPTMHTQ